MSELRIRPMQDSDRPFIRDLFGESERELQAMDPDNSPEPDSTELDGKIADAFRLAWTKASCWVAELDGQRVGFVIAGPANNPPPSLGKRPKRQLRIGEIHELHVSKAHRARGVGSALLRDAERYLASEGFDKILIRYMTKNDPASSLYSARGYTRYRLTAVKRIRED